MKTIAIFCVESKNSTCDSDGVYIRTILDEFYNFDKHKTIIRFVYMNGKNNYQSKSVKKSIDLIKKKAGKEDKVHVFYVCDKDNYVIQHEDQLFINQLEAYCKQNDFPLIWMNRNIEDVFWETHIETKDKTSAAARFKRTHQLQKINIQNLNQIKASKQHTSNILTVLDHYFNSKENGMS